MADLSQSAFVLDQSVINYGRLASLGTLRQNPQYRFAEISIPVETQPNTGMIGEVRDDSDLAGIYFSKCFFIALSQGLKKINIQYAPFDLMEISGFMDQFTMVDTDNHYHARCIQFLVDALQTIQIHVFIGKKDEHGKWSTTPDYSAKFGDGEHVIRILNMGIHFELITTDSAMFTRDTRSMTPEKAQLHQYEVMQMIKQKEEDYLLAKWLAENDD